ncbi:MAG: hypothetical protein QM704_24710 [Anaeromyxobacteraceae bacterium]
MKRRRRLTLVVSVLLGLAVGVAGVKVGQAFGARPTAAADGAARAHPLLLSALALLGTYLALLLHEAGHVLGGLSQGFRFLFLAAGPLWLERGPGGRGLAVRLNRIPATWGGVAACVPLDDRAIVRRMAVLAAGGPAMSLALAAGAWAAARAVAPGTGLAVVLGVTALASGLFFLATAQPFGAGGGFMSDGGRLRALLSGGPRAAREAALLSLTAASTAGVRPRAWPEQAVRDLAAHADGGAMDLGAAMLRYSWHLDRGDVAAAEADLAAARAKAEVSALARDALATEAAWFEAAVKGDAARARAALPARAGALVEAWQWHRARAAVLLAEGDRESAGAALALATAALEKPRFQRPSVMDRETVAALGEKLGLAVRRLSTPLEGHLRRRPSGGVRPRAGAQGGGLGSAPSARASSPTSSITQRPSSLTIWKKMSFFSKLKKKAWTTAWSAVCERTFTFRSARILCSFQTS